MRPPAIHHFGPDPQSVGGMQSVLRVVSDWRIGGDAVVVHPTWAPGTAAMLVRAARATRAAAALTRDDVAHVHVSYGGSFVREGAIAALTSLRRVPTVLTIHGSRFLESAAEHPRLARAVLRRAHAISCLSEEVAAFAERAVAGTGAAVELIPNPVAPEAAYTPADETPEVVLFGGAVGLRKGVDVLCAAWARLAPARPGARCVVVGPPGDFVPPSLPRLEVRPAVGPAEMRELMRGARVVVLPSRAEGMPMLLTEALGAGRPFVSTPVGGTPELAATGGGVLVPVGDAVALAAALERFLGSPAEAAAHGEAGRRFYAATRSPAALDPVFRRLYASARATAASGLTAP